MGNITQLHQGSLNGLRKQTNECIDSAYNKGYEDGKKEPREAKAVNVEDTNEYQIGYKVGLEDEKKQAIEEIPELANKENEIYNDGYNKGLEDVNHAMDILKSMTGTECAEWFEDCVGVDEVVCGFTVQRIVEITKAYEEKKKAEEEIKVGDEVKDLATNNIGVVLGIGERVLYITKFDYVYSNTRGSLEKTGRHFGEVEQLLDKMKGE